MRRRNGGRERGREVRNISEGKRKKGGKRERKRWGEENSNTRGGMEGEGYSRGGMKGVGRECKPIITFCLSRI